MAIKFVLMVNCKFGDKCNLAHNCDCIDKFAARIKEAVQKKALQLGQPDKAQPQR